VWSLPAATASKASCVSTAAGVRVHATISVDAWHMSDELLPSWPSSFAPQHSARPSAARPHTWLTMLLTPPADRPESDVCDMIAAGFASASLRTPRPSWPVMLMPQQWIAPLTEAHDRPAPATIDVAGNWRLA
jgi:hypothetical protein